MGGKTLGKISLILVGIGIVISLIGRFFISSSVIVFLFSSLYPLLIYLISLLLPLIFMAMAVKKNSGVFGILSVIFAILFVALASFLSFTKVMFFY